MQNESICNTDNYYCINPVEAYWNMFLNLFRKNKLKIVRNPASPNRHVSIMEAVSIEAIQAHAASFGLTWLKESK